MSNYGVGLFCVICIFLALSQLSGCATAGGRRDSAWVTQAGLDTKFCAVNVEGQTYPYRVYFPSNYRFAPAAPGGPAPLFPMVVMLHGAGGDENWYFEWKGSSDRVQTIAEEKGYVVVCPALPHSRVAATDRPANVPQLAEEVRTAAVPVVEAVIAEMLKQRNISPERIYLTGASKGGMTLYAVAAANPERYAAIAPVATMPRQDWLDQIAKVPTFILHGKRDRGFPIEGVRAVRDALAERGCDVKMHEFEGGHGGYRNMEAYRMIFDWFDSHRRQAQNPRQAANPEP